jgi:poly-gamma-glutamate synthesis protein (capsule biosynthesis protein)
MYFPSLSPQTGQLVALEMTPLQIRHMRLNRASPADTRWLCATVSEISRAFGTMVTVTERGTLRR